jgi:hypothetical protein
VKEETTKPLGYAATFVFDVEEPVTDKKERWRQPVQRSYYVSGKDYARLEKHQAGFFHFYDLEGYARAVNFEHVLEWFALKIFPKGKEEKKKEAAQEDNNEVDEEGLSEEESPEGEEEDDEMDGEGDDDIDEDERARQEFKRLMDKAD